jgi:hypothetical protein
MREAAAQTRHLIQLIALTDTLARCHKKKKERNKINPLYHLQFQDSFAGSGEELATFLAGLPGHYDAIHHHEKSV